MCYVKDKWKDIRLYENEKSTFVVNKGIKMELCITD
jgi:hypothetical protein